MSEISSDYKNLLKYYLDLIKTIEVVRAGSRSTIELTILDAQENNQEIPHQLINEITKFYEGLKIDDFIDHLLPVYHKYLSENDLLDLISFHKTPIGQKMINLNPYIVADMIPAIDNWTNISTKKIIEKLQSNGKNN